MKKQQIKRKQQIFTVLTIAIFILIVVTIFGVRFLLKEKGYIKDSGSDSITTNAGAKSPDKEKEPNTAKEDKEAEQTQQKAELVEKADRLAAAYDYDGAVELVKTFAGYENDTILTDKIKEYEDTKATCVPVNIDEVTHIFYHSLVVDPELAFANQETNPQAVGNNQWMTTVSEFNKITQEMYDRGYVLVRLKDLINITTDENGQEVYQPATIMLPPGKKAFVMSQDDLSYYHSYDNYGYASKMILNDEGKPVCEYVQPDGTTVVGDYDVVPLLDKFIEEHPDASYKGAKGTIALTGYNGILGYRTDISYQEIPADISRDKKAWLEANPDFNLENERAEAKKVAEGMIADGWEFGSHTWGHLKVGEASLERIQADTQKWKANIEPLVGPTDVIIFAHGEDLGKWGDYDETNAKYQYLREQGYNIFCNVDSAQYGVWFGPNYLRHSRRNLDGYRIYNNLIGNEDSVSDLFDPKEIIDPLRPPVMPLNK